MSLYKTIIDPLGFVLNSQISIPLSVRLSCALTEYSSKNIGNERGKAMQDFIIMIKFSRLFQTGVGSHYDGNVSISVTLK